jgi:hypothetical protein
VSCKILCSECLDGFQFAKSSPNRGMGPGPWPGGCSVLSQGAGQVQAM